MWPLLATVAVVYPFPSLRIAAGAAPGRARGGGVPFLTDANMTSPPGKTVDGLLVASPPWHDGIWHGSKSSQHRRQMQSTPGAGRAAEYQRQVARDIS